VVKWENHENRTLKPSSHTTVCTQDEIQFRKLPKLETIKRNEPPVDVQAVAEPRDRTVHPGVLVKYATEEGILGICAAPDWEKKPIGLTFIGNKEWLGEVPAGKEFKFVLLQNGKVVKWEQRENRTLESSSLSCTYFDENEVRFT
jgi:hypothetical protein